MSQVARDLLVVAETCLIRITYPESGGCRPIPAFDNINVRSISSHARQSCFRLAADGRFCGKEDADCRSSKLSNIRT